MNTIQKWDWLEANVEATVLRKLKLKMFEAYLDEGLWEEILDKWLWEEKMAPDFINWVVDEHDLDVPWEEKITDEAA